MSPQGGNGHTISPDVLRVEGKDIDEANEHRHHPFATMIRITSTYGFGSGIRR